MLSRHNRGVRAAEGKDIGQIETLNAAKLHFAAILNGRRNGAFVVFYINAKNRMINEDTWVSSVDRTLIYIREILRRAVVLDASAILVAHNHPSGDLTPSLVGLRLTHKLELVLDIIDVVLFDHMIFGEGEPYSLRTNGDF